MKTIQHFHGQKYLKWVLFWNINKIRVFVGPFYLKQTQGHHWTAYLHVNNLVNIVVFTKLFTSLLYKATLLQFIQNQVWCCLPLRTTILLGKDVTLMAALFSVSVVLSHIHHWCNHRWAFLHRSLITARLIYFILGTSTPELLLLLFL